MSTGVVVWITGAPSSGKSTFAAKLQRALEYDGRPCCVVDGDAVRDVLVPRPDYTEEGRSGFYSTLAGLAALLAEQGLVVIVPATAHRRAYRDDARKRAPRFVEVWLDVSADECRARDAKGLYAAVESGTARNVPGADLEYEPPTKPDVVLEDALDPRSVSDVMTAIRHVPTTRPPAPGREPRGG